MTKNLVLPDNRLVLPHTFGISEDFVGRPTRKYHQYLLADLAAGADLAATVIFSPGEPIMVADVLITPDGSAAGVDASNTSVWTVANGANTIVTQTFDATPAYPTDNTQTSLGAVSNTLVPAGGRIELTVTNGATADLPPTLVTIEYYSLDGIGSFKALGDPASGLTFRDAMGGLIDLVTGATDNDEIYLATQSELFKFDDLNPLEFIARIAFAEANTDDINVIVGLANAVAANYLVDDGGGPPSSYSGAVFFKLDGGTKWVFETSLSTTQTTTTLSHTAPGGATDFHTLKILAKKRDATTVELIPYIDEAGGQDLKQCTDANGALVKHTITLGSPTEMQAFIGAKAGGANAETVTADYLACHQLR